MNEVVFQFTKNFFSHMETSPLTTKIISKLSLYSAITSIEGYRFLIVPQTVTSVIYVIFENPLHSHFGSGTGGNYINIITCKASAHLAELTDSAATVSIPRTSIFDIISGSHVQHKPMCVHFCVHKDFSIPLDFLSRKIYNMFVF